MDELVTGSFPNADDANNAIDRLVEMGFPSNDISVIMSPETRRGFSDRPIPGESQGADIAKGAAGGGMIGGTLGAIIAGALATTGAIGVGIATGGVGLPFIAGPLAAALVGGGAGAAAGSVIGAVLGAGASHEQIHDVEGQIKSGNIVVAVHTDSSQSEDVRALLRSKNYARI